MAKKETLVLVDGHALIYRAFHALPLTLTTSKGELTNAVFGFTQMLLDVLRRERPECVIMTFDVGKTFRHEEFDGYKAHRQPMPDDLVNQQGRVREVVDALNIPVFVQPGYEADDVIGTLALDGVAKGVEVLIVTGDSDALQLVRPGVRVLTPGHFRFSDTRMYDDEAVLQRYGFAPSFIPDYKALVGDTSDNIPGVPGIGQKTATSLIQKFGPIEEMERRIDEVTPPRIQNLLRENMQTAVSSKRLATIVTDLPIEMDLDTCRTTDFDRDSVIRLFRELEFRTLVPKIPEPEAPGQEHLEDAKQLSMFGERSQTKTVAPLMPRETATVEKGYQTVTTREELAGLVSRLANVDTLVVDVETTSTDVMKADLVGISLSPGPGESYYIPVGHETGQPQIEQEEVIRAVGPILENPSLELWAHNGKYDWVVLARHGIQIPGVDADSMIAAYLLGENSLRLKDLAFTRLGVEMTPITDLIGTGKGQLTMAQVPVERVGPYASADADMTYRLMAEFAPELRDKGLWELFQNVEMPLVPVLGTMEMNGIALDTQFLQQMSTELYRKIQELEEEIYKLAKVRFNINSTKQLGEILFGSLGLPGKKRTQTGFSTDANVLESLRGEHPIVDALLEYRQLVKLKSTYVDALPLLVNPFTGRVHTSFNQTITTTGRLSSSDPNLQNIPIRTELGRKVRRAFTADNFSNHQLVPGHTILLAADYSQVELRILAHVTRDPHLVEAFELGQDVHASTAAEVFSVPIEEVTSDMRRMAKVVNFGVIYGMSSYGLARDTGLGQREAAAFIEKYMRRYMGVKEYVERTIEEARRTGYVTTVLGRRRYIPEINARDNTRRQAAERMAINMPIQGTAADIMKIAMIKVYDAMQDMALKSKLLLQVHDELVFEVPDEELEQVKSMATSLMEGAYPLSIHLKVETKMGQTWGDME